MEHYNTPELDGPYTAYETPSLIDVSEMSACDWGCVTGGDAGGNDDISISTK